MPQPVVKPVVAIHMTRARPPVARATRNRLTATKLERLMDRYAGKEWLPTPLEHLDLPESEKADVLRGLRTYVAASAENARTFAELYAKLPAERQVLPPEIVPQLRASVLP